MDRTGVVWVAPHNCRFYHGWKGGFLLIVDFQIFGYIFRFLVYFWTFGYISGFRPLVLLYYIGFQKSNIGDLLVGYTVSNCDSMGEDTNDLQSWP